MSYYSAVQFEREPFSTSPDPDFFYRSADHLTALNRLEIAIRLRRGLSVILGDVGTGKTTLSRALFQAFEFDEDYVFHMILNPHFDSEESFLMHLANLFGIQVWERTHLQLRNAIEKYLFTRNVEEGKVVVLVIDEAQKLAPAQLETLRTLLNYETNEYKFLQLVLLGQCELWSAIREMSNLRDRICFKHLLSALDERETAEMIRFRLEKAGYPAPSHLFTPAAVRQIYQYSQGRPRPITMMCHSAIERLVMQEANLVTEDMVRDIISEERKWA